VTVANSTGIFLVSGSTISLIARTGNGAPEASGVFAKLGDPVLNNNGAVAFMAAIKIGTDNVTAATQSEIWSNASGGLQPIAQEGTRPEDANTFASFAQIVLPDFQDVAYLANTASLAQPPTMSQSVWATVTPAFGEEPDDLVATVGGAYLAETQFFRGTPKPIMAIRIFQGVPTALGQSRSFDATTGYLVYKATFADGSWGIYVAAPQ
jgi:hypothetical protein